MSWLFERRLAVLPFFFFNDTATTEIYTLSLHDALPIFGAASGAALMGMRPIAEMQFIDFITCAYDILVNFSATSRYRDRKSTRLNSSHQIISYAVFCLKKKKKKQQRQTISLLCTS